MTLADLAAGYSASRRQHFNLPLTVRIRHGDPALQPASPADREPGLNAASHRSIFLAEVVPQL